MIYAVLPLNRLDQVKSRLDGVVQDRPTLALDFATHVLGVLRATGRFSKVAVVSPEQRLGEWCLARQVDFLWQPDQGLNAALDLARGWAQGDGAVRLMVVLGDLPWLRPKEVEGMLDCGERAQVVVAPDRSDTGTNMLLLSPPGAIPFMFGEASCSAHLTQARSLGLTVEVYRALGTQNDVDTPQDLEELRCRV